MPAEELSATISDEFEHHDCVYNNPHNASPDAHAFLLVRFLATGPKDQAARNLQLIATYNCVAEQTLFKFKFDILSALPTLERG